jgi:hypothetical protein
VTRRRVGSDHGPEKRSGNANGSGSESCEAMQHRGVHVLETPRLSGGGGQPAVATDAVTVG